MKDHMAYCTVRDAALRLGVSTTHVYRLIAAGRLEAVQVGDHRRTWLVKRQSVTDIAPRDPWIGEFDEPAHNA